MEAFLKIQHFYLWKCTEYSDKEIDSNEQWEEMRTVLHDNRFWAKYSMFDKNNTCCQARNIELHWAFTGGLQWRHCLQQSCLKWISFFQINIIWVWKSHWKVYWERLRKMYLFYSSVHLIKNIKTNLLNKI